MVLDEVVMANDSRFVTQPFVMIQRVAQSLNDSLIQSSFTVEATDSHVGAGGMIGGNSTQLLVRLASVAHLAPNSMTRRRLDNK